MARDGVMGGENRDFEIGEFPRLKKRAIFDKAAGGAYIIDADAAQPFVPRSAAEPSPHAL